MFLESYFLDRLKSRRQTSSKVPVSFSFFLSFTGEPQVKKMTFIKDIKSLDINACEFLFMF
ncbi:hypothetical protein Bca101_019757 [Brassica carinata]